MLALGGELMPMAMRAGEQPQQVLHVARRSAPLAVVSVALDRATGQLSVLGESALPASMAHVQLSRNGRWLYSASYGADLLAMQPVLPDGRVGPVSAQRSTGRHAHCTAPSPDGRYLLVTALGANTVTVHALDADQGLQAATPASNVEAPRGTGARHLCFNPRGDRVYLLGELDAKVHVFDFDSRLGELRWRQTVACLPKAWPGTPWGADLLLSHCGRWLYSSERHSSLITGFVVHPSSGELSLLGHWPTQTQPRGMGLSAGGGHLIVAGQLSHQLGVHQLCPDTGVLTLCSEQPVGQGPNWVVSCAAAAPAAPAAR